MGKERVDRRDRRRPARRRDRHRGGAPRPRLHRLHGPRGHAPPAAQRRADAPPRRRGRAGRRRQPHAQGRDQRGAARLGDQRAHHALRARLGARTRSVPADGARLPPRDRRGGARPAPRRHRPAAARSRDRLRRRRLERHRALLGLPRRAAGAARSASRRAGAGDALGRARGALRPRRRRRSACCTAPRRWCCRTRTARSRQRTRSRPGSTIPRWAPSTRCCAELGRVEYTARERRRGGGRLPPSWRETEGILPALESAHAVAEAMRRARRLSRRQIVLVNLSGRGDKDLESVLAFDRARAEESR